jgi:hypothetical protein
MRRFLVVLAACCISPSLWAATTYTYTGGAYTSLTTFTAPCASGPCANYPGGSSVNGSFTTAAPLAGGLSNVNVYPSVTAFSFTDGLNTYSSADLNSRTFQFLVTTNPSGNITGFSILIEHWLTGSNPHSTADKFSYFFITSTGVNAVNNQLCALAVGVSIAGVPDTCTTSSGTNASSSSGQTANAGTWITGAGPGPVSTAAVPTLSELAIIVLSLLVAAIAILAMRRRLRSPIA